MKPNMPASTADSTPRPPNGRGDARQAAAARAAHAQSFGTMESSLSVCLLDPALVTQPPARRHRLPGARRAQATFAVPWKNPRARPNRINASRLQGGNAMAPRRQHSRCEFSHRGGVCEHGSKVQPPRCRESVPCAPALKRRKCRQKRRRKLHPFAGRLITGSWPSSSSQLYNAIDTSSDVNWRAKSRSGARAGRDMAGPQTSSMACRETWSFVPKASTESAVARESYAVAMSSNLYKPAPAGEPVAGKLMNSSAVLARGLAAKEHASAKDKRADHRRVNVEMAATFGECFAPCKLSDEVAASAPQRPPTSIARNATPAARPAQLRLRALLGLVLQRAARRR